VFRNVGAGRDGAGRRISSEVKRYRVHRRAALKKRTSTTRIGQPAEGGRRGQVDWCLKSCPVSEVDGRGTDQIAAPSTRWPRRSARISGGLIARRDCDMRLVDFSGRITQGGTESCDPPSSSTARTGQGRRWSTWGSAQHRRRQVSRACWTAYQLGNCWPRRRPGRGNRHDHRRYRQPCAALVQKGIPDRCRDDGGTGGDAARLLFPLYAFSIWKIAPRSVG